MSDNVGHEGGSAPLLDLSAIVKVLWQRRLLIIAAIVACVGVAALYITFTKPVFTATAVMLIDPREARTTDIDNVLPGIGSDSAAIASQVVVIGSRELLGAVFEAEGLAKDPEFAGAGFLSELRGRIPTREEAFERFIDSVWVERQGLTYVIAVNVSSREPEKAARIANAIVERYIADQAREKSQANAEVSGLLKSQIAGLERDVLADERAVEDFKVANNIFGSGTGPTVLQAKLDQLNAQLLTAQEQAREAETKLQQALAAGETPQGLISLTEILTSPNAEKLRESYNLRATAVASGRNTYGARHPSLRRLQSELASVEGLMIREVQRLTEELRANRDIANSIVARIEAEIARLRAEANLADQKFVRNAEASRLVLEQFQKRAEETGQFQNLQFAEARLITRATAPLRPTWPRPTLLLGVGGMLGLAVGSGLALQLGARQRGQAEAPAPERRPLAVAPAPTPPTPLGSAMRNNGGAVPRGPQESNAAQG